MEETKVTHCPILYNIHEIFGYNAHSYLGGGGDVPVTVGIIGVIVWEVG